MSGGVDVLAIGAHPDDVEIGCGGALLLSVDAGRSVVVADLTAGEMSTRGSVQERDGERQRAAELLGVRERVSLGLPDTRVGTDPSHRDAIAALIRRFRPRLVLAPFASDRHPDHEATGRLAREACFLAGVAKAGMGEPHRPARFYGYMIHHPFEPTFVVDVTRVWDRRTEVVAAYRSQFGPGSGPSTELSGGNFIDRLRDRAGYFGSMIGTERGEPFICQGPLAVSGLPDFKTSTTGSLLYRKFL